MFGWFSCFMTCRGRRAAAWTGQLGFAARVRARAETEMNTHRQLAVAEAAVLQHLLDGDALARLLRAREGRRDRGGARAWAAARGIWRRARASRARARTCTVASNTTPNEPWPTTPPSVSGRMRSEKPGVLRRRRGARVEGGKIKVA